MPIAIGQPDKISTNFGRKATKNCRGEPRPSSKILVCEGYRDLRSLLETSSVSTLRSALGFSNRFKAASNCRRNGGRNRTGSNQSIADDLEKLLFRVDLKIEARGREMR